MLHGPLVLHCQLLCPVSSSSIQLEAQHTTISSLTAISRSLICFNVDFRLNAGRLLLLLLWQRRLKGDCSCLIGRRQPRRRCFSSSSLSLRSNFSTLLFFMLKPFHQVNVKLTWNVHLLQQSPPSLLGKNSFHGKKKIRQKKKKWGWWEKDPRRPAAPPSPLPPPLFPLLQNCTIDGVDNVEGFPLN